MLDFSVIIPTKNEEKYLPKLLDSIKNQSLQPKEIIVSDDSTDATRQIALSYGAKVVQGVSDGRIGLGRNRGAKAATGEYFIFLDADVVLPPGFFEQVFQKIIDDDIDLATVAYEPLEHPEKYKTPFEISNKARAISSKLPLTFLESGACMIIKKSVFDDLAGFNEEIFLNEDHDLVHRVKKSGYKYAMLPNKVYLSVRRYEGRKKSELLGLLIWGIGALALLHLWNSVYKKQEVAFSKRYFKN